MDTMIAPRIGHNGPPLVDPDKLGDLSKRLDEFMAASTTIRNAYKEEPLRSEDDAKRIGDHIAGLRGLGKQIETFRVEAKKPYDDKAKAVQELFAPLKDRVDRAVKAMLDITTDFINWQRAEEAKRQAAEQAAAAEARRIADEAEARAKETGDLDAEAEAERLRKTAEAQTKDAERERKVNVSSATGAGRTISAVKIRSAKLLEPRTASLGKLFMHYRDRPEVEELLLRLANADIRAKDVDESLIPGIEITEENNAR
jgi:hypothetical protein